MRPSLLPHLAASLLCLHVLAGVARADNAVSRISTFDRQACADLRTTHVMRENAPIRCEQLRRVHFSYVDFDGAQHDDGEIVVLAAAALQVQAIFATLLQQRFPLARARPLTHYRGDDEASMRDNNTSAFNDRAITHGHAPSLHAYGLAIDINPVQNPYVNTRSHDARFHPAAGSRYADRTTQRAGMTEEIVELFARHGFPIWGGDWKVPVDYQHFQTSRALARKLAALPPDQAHAAFDSHVAAYRRCRASGRTRIACAQ